MTRKEETDPIELLERRGTYSKTFLHPDGSLNTRITTDPIHFQDASGAWLEIDNTLVPHPGGGFTNTANEFKVRFASSADAAELVSVEFEGKRLAFGFEGAAAVSPTVSGSTIVYPEVLPDVDLKFEVSAEMLKEYVVLKSPAAVTSGSQDLRFRFPMTLTGLSPQELTDELLLNSSGLTVFKVPHMFMFDSAGGSGGEPALSEDISLSVAGSGSSLALEAHVDSSWLLDPQRVYPVTIDPTTINDRRPSLDTFVQSNIANTAQSTSAELKSGYYTGAEGTFTAQSLLRFDLSDVPFGATINTATLQLFENHSYSCSARTVEIRRIGESWNSGVTWNTKPSFSATVYTSKNVAYGYSTSCPGQRVDFPVTSLVEEWKNTPSTNYGFGVRAADQSDVYGWKKFASNEASHTPWLDVTYTEADTTAPNVTGLTSSPQTVEANWYASTSASLSWSGVDNTGGSGVAGYSYVLNQTEIHDPDTVSEGATASKVYSVLDQGISHFHVRAKDNAGNWGTSKHYTLKVDTVVPGGPSITSGTHTRDACSTSASPAFSWSSSDSTSGIQGYGTAFDQSSGTTPVTSSVSTSTSGNFSAPNDGDWWMHVRAKDKAGNLSGSSHYKVRINALPAAAPTIVSSSHAEGVWSSNRSFNISWSLNDTFGVNGYSYVLDQSPGTVPDATSEGVGTSYSTTISGDGTYYFHVRGLDGCGSWGNTRHYTVRVDGTASGVPVVSSTSHPSDSTWYSDRTADLAFSVSDVSGIDGYSHIVDGVPTTTPDTVSEGNSASLTTISLGDGTHYFHVRARNGAGLWSAASHRGLKIDGTAPLGPTVSSSSHGDALADYPNNDPALSWSAPSDLSGIAGYSYVIDQSSTTMPDMISEGLGVSTTYTDLADGTYYFHIRARDVAGNWGEVTHRRVGVSVPAPHVVPTMTGPAGQLDAEGKSVVKNGDLLTFGGRITEGAGVNASSDLAAVVSTCNLVVKNEAGAMVNTIVVPSTSCRNSSGNLVSSFAPSTLGTSAGTVHLEVVVQRTAGGVTKSSGVQRSEAIKVDTSVPVLSAALLGCTINISSQCVDERTVDVEFSEPIKGSLLAADFSVQGTAVIGVSSTCSGGAWCDEASLTVTTPIDERTGPLVGYKFASAPTRVRPNDGPLNSLSDSSVPMLNLRVDEETDLPGDLLTLPAGEVVSDLASTSAGDILTIDNNALQALADVGDSTCDDEFSGVPGPTEAEANQRDRCDEDGREMRWAKRIVALAQKGMTDDGFGSAPDVVLLQEVRTVDAKRIAGWLNALIELDGAVCATADASNRCFRVAIGSSKRKVAETRAHVVISDTAIIYNKRTMALEKTGAFRTAYGPQWACEPKVDQSGGLLFIDVDKDGINDCGKRRTVRQHHLAELGEIAPGGAGAAVASMHLVTSSYLKSAEHETAKAAWAQKSVGTLGSFATSSDFRQIGGDFNIHRCHSDVRPEPIDPNDCQERDWWDVYEANGYVDSVYEQVKRVPLDREAEMDRQYSNGSQKPSTTPPPEPGESPKFKRIDFIFSQLTPLRVDLLDASKDYTCGLADESRQPDERTCDFLSNSERYSDHNLVWALVRKLPLIVPGI